MNGYLARAEALLGAAATSRLESARVLVVGVGGVGSWCAEALVRTGVGGVALMDDDRVVESNCNRQLQALPSTIGESKVKALRERLLTVNPKCAVEAIDRRFEGDFDFSPYDAIVDAIDSVDCKAKLIIRALDAGKPVFSSMGAALRLNPTAVVASDFEQVAGDALARALRRRFRESGKAPGAFRCVWSKERPMECAERGSLVTVTATFGMALASEVVRCLVA